MSGPMPAGGAPAPPLPMPALQFCVPPNPTADALRKHAELGLRKLRSGRNISGILREVPSYAAPTDTTTGMPVVVNGQINLPSLRAVPPTAYRYSALIARAKELVGQASLVESQYLAAIERLDDATYTRLQAQQALAQASAQERLETLRVNESNDNAALARLQTQRAVIQQQTYESWLADGLNEFESAMLELYAAAAVMESVQVANNATLEAAKAFTTAATAGATSAVAAVTAASVVSALSAQGAVIGVTQALNKRDIQVNALWADMKRRADEWRYQAALANQDIQIGKQGEKLADDQVAISNQAKVIAELTTAQARDTIEFLANRFAGAELWDFMMGVYGSVYRGLLQQAAAVLNVAKAQLGFERQEPPPIQILSDYWADPAGPQATLSTSSGETRRGLTGSARLLADLYQLDQYAFDTEKRKTAVTRTISLAQLVPAEFQRFRESGVLVFATPAELFDRDFPGLYLRLLRRVSVSVIALVPPVDGVKATLSSTGVSRAVVGPEPFQNVVIRREPETVAISVPIGGTGAVEVEGGGMYMPFEGGGVDAMWELRLPRAANRFDFASLSDVLLTYEYTALFNADYRQRVTQQLSPELSAEMAFSLRNDFPDAWYDLHNPEQLDEPQRYLVRFRVTPQDVPANLESVRVKHVVVRLATTETMLHTFTFPVLRRTDDAGRVVAASSPVRAIEGVVSTRNSNGSPWQPLLGAGAAGLRPTPFGEWELSLRSTVAADRTALADALAGGTLSDIQVVIGYAATTPPWPA